MPYSLAPNYYDNSNSRLCPPAALLAIGLLGCGASAAQLAREAPHVPIVVLSASCRKRSGRTRSRGCRW